MVWDILDVWKRRMGINLRSKWRIKLDLSPHNLDVLIVRLGCEAPHRRIIHPFISANCCSILNGELGLFRINLIAAYLSSFFYRLIEDRLGEISEKITKDFQLQKD